MLELQEHTGKLKVENYGLWEFLQDLQQGVSQGYELDESNEGFPQVFGSLYTCLLKKQQEVPSPIEVTEVHPEVPVQVQQDKTPEVPVEQPVNKQPRKQKG